MYVKDSPIDQRYRCSRFSDWLKCSGQARESDVLIAKQCDRQLIHALAEFWFESGHDVLHVSQGECFDLLERDGASEGPTYLLFSHEYLATRLDMIQGIMKENILLILDIGESPATEMLSVLSALLCNRGARLIWVRL